MPRASRKKLQPWCDIWILGNVLAHTYRAPSCQEPYLTAHLNNHHNATDGEGWGLVYEVRQ